MITQPLLLPQHISWQDSLKNLITCPLALLAYLEIAPESVPWQWDRHFPVRVTRSFSERMQKGNPEDPLLKQVLSLNNESLITEGYETDPLQERQQNPIPGLLHKYSSRVLLTFTTSCAIHCRYCFRRHFPYADNQLGKKRWPQILDYLTTQPDVFEVILSGGDPLMAPNAYIAEFLQQLSTIEHIKIIRFHSRLPVVLPQRIDDELLTILAEPRFQKVMVYHINHPQELTPEITQGVRALKQLGIAVFNQAVLLKGINDNVETLKQLSLSLFQSGIQPYYLHQLDRVQGTQHFAIDPDTIEQLMKGLRASLPGYLVPQFVKEIPNEPYKTPL